MVPHGCRNCGCNFYPGDSDADEFDAFCGSECEDEWWDEEDAAYFDEDNYDSNYEDRP